MSNAEKKARGQNWSTEESEFLLECVGKVVDVLENKKTDNVSSKRKKSAWSWIVTKFEENPSCKARTDDQIFYKWKAMKAVGFFSSFIAFSFFLLMSTWLWLRLCLLLVHLVGWATVVRPAVPQSEMPCTIAPSRFSPRARPGNGREESY